MQGTAADELLAAGEAQPLRILFAMYPSPGLLAVPAASPATRLEDLRGQPAGRRAGRRPLPGAAAGADPRDPGAPPAAAGDGTARRHLCRHRVAAADRRFGQRVLVREDLAPARAAAVLQALQAAGPALAAARQPASCAWMPVASRKRETML
ncbi:hypothetical protein ABXN37_04165 [Piscinibacter sakaiensis]|uniref:hypothetical protein n=1 Tax=Piscinibacter sakaiensis TaxID=1547922 RepID=UPI00372C1374